MNTAICDCEVEHMAEISNIKKEFQKETEKMELAFKVTQSTSLTFYRLRWTS